jgi:hypothetical protein
MRVTVMRNGASMHDSGTLTCRDLASWVKRRRRIASVTTLLLRCGLKRIVQPRRRLTSFLCCGTINVLDVSTKWSAAIEPFERVAFVRLPSCVLRAAVILRLSRENSCYSWCSTASTRASERQSTQLRIFSVKLLLF